MAETEINKFPTPDEFFLKISLYEKFVIEDLHQVMGVEFYSGTLDCRCIGCNRESVFESKVAPISVSGNNQWMHLSTHLKYPPQALINIEHHAPVFRHKGINSTTPTLNEYFYADRFFVVNFACTRNSQHSLFFCFVVDNAELMKVGQQPSLVEIEKLNMEKYKKILSEEKYKELNRAVGLITHGVGIGSFVYLRRIFESLLDDARNNAKQAGGWDDNRYNQLRFDEKLTP